MSNPNSSFDTVFSNPKLFKIKSGLIRPRPNPSLAIKKKPYSTNTKSHKLLSPRRSAQVTLPPIRPYECSKSPENQDQTVYQVKKLDLIPKLHLLAPTKLSPESNSLSLIISEDKIRENSPIRIQETFKADELPTPHFNYVGMQKSGSVSKINKLETVINNKLPHGFCDRLCFKKVKSQEKILGIIERNERTRQNLVYHKIKVLEHRFPVEFKVNLSHS